MKNPHKHKMGLWSIVLLGLNTIIGSGIFLIPQEAMRLVGPSSVAIFAFDALLAGCISLCFAEMAGRFNKNGGAYVYARAAFGEFVGFEVGFMKWIVTMTAWATLSVALLSVVEAVWVDLQTPANHKKALIGLFVLLASINLLGVKFSKVVGNVVSMGKLIPLVLFVGLGVLFIQPHHFVPFYAPYSVGDQSPLSAIATAALMIFYAFTGFESVVVAAEDMQDPQHNLPKAIVIILAVLVTLYVLVHSVCIGTLGPLLATTPIPIASAFRVFLGESGHHLVITGMLIAIGGSNLASSFIAPRVGVALAQDRLLPGVLAAKNRFGAPYVSIIITSGLSCCIALSGTFAKLAMMSAMASFLQYIPTCLAVLRLRQLSPDQRSHFHLPAGALIPLMALVIIGFMLLFVSRCHLLWGLASLALGVPVYWVGRYYRRGTRPPKA
jgi:amino acid transporter